MQRVKSQIKQWLNVDGASLTVFPIFLPIPFNLSSVILVIYGVTKRQ